MDPRPTVLFQPLNHIGLGHINRLSIIALALHEIDKDIRTPFAVEGACHVLLDARGLPYIPLPDSHLMNEPVLWAEWSNRERTKIQVQVGRSILEAMAPQVVVFDCLPNPAFLEAVIECDIPIVLCLREMRNLPSYLRKISVLLEHVERIIIPHPTGTFSLPEKLEAKSYFVGQIARATSTQHHAPDLATNLVLITGGGGGYPGTADFYNLALQSVAELRRHLPHLRGHLITGPLFCDWHLLQLTEGVTVAPFEPNMPARFAESGLVICQAGYNTVAELELVGAKTVLMPAARQWDDQFARAERVSHGHVNFRTFRGTTPNELAQLASEFLSESISCHTAILPADGSMKAAQLIYEMVRADVRVIGAAN